MVDNKKIVTDFFKYVSFSNDTKDQANENISKAFELVSDEVVWWVPEGLPFSGNKSKKEYLKIIQMIQNAFPTGFELKVTSMIGEGNIVAAEVESKGTSTKNRDYHNKYHFLFEFKDSKIISVKEYMNTKHLAEIVAP